MESGTVLQNLKKRIVSEFPQFFVFEAKNKTYLINKERILWVLLDRKYIAIHFEAKRLIVDENGEIYFETEELGS